VRTRGWGDVSQCSSAWEASAARLNHASPEEGSSAWGTGPCPSCLSGTGAAELPHQPTHTLRSLQGAARLEDVPAHTNPTCSAGSPAGDASLLGFSLLPRSAAAPSQPAAPRGRGRGRRVPRTRHSPQWTWTDSRAARWGAPAA